MEPNTNYWNKDRVPKARIVFDNIIARADAIASVAAGDGKVDIVTNLTVDEAKAFKSDKAKIQANNAKTVLAAVINIKKGGALADVGVRKALAMAIDKAALVKNGLGGYGSSTLCCMNTRRYHGLLVAATKPPVGRMVLLAKMEESLILDGRSYELSVNRYPGAVYPQGHLCLKQFRLDPFPVFVYEVEGIQLQKSVFMVYGESTTVIQYELSSPVENCTLELRPLIAFRDYHSTTHENAALDPALDIQAGSVRIAPYRDLPSLWLAHNGDEVRAAGTWYRNFEFDRERERGLDYLEDLLHPCTIVLNLRGGTRRSVIASTEAHAIQSADRLRDSEIERRRKILRAPLSARPFVQNFPMEDDKIRLSNYADELDQRATELEREATDEP